MSILMPWNVPGYVWHHWLELGLVFGAGYALAFKGRLGRS